MTLIIAYLVLPILAIIAKMGTFREADFTVDEILEREPYAPEVEYQS